VWQGGYLCTGCGSSCAVFTAASGAFSDGSPGQYQHKSHCSWIIAPQSAANVTINFTSVNTEPGFDYVWVYMCADINCLSQTRTLLAQLSGTQGGSYTSTTGYMLVTFTSDSGVSDDGFAASWTSQAVVCMLFLPAAAYSSVLHLEKTKVCHRKNKSVSSLMAFIGTRSCLHMSICLLP
jgi:hypothetical protein